MTPKLVSTLIALAVLFVLPTLSGSESIDLCGFERPQIVEEIWPVFIHDPGKPAEMEIPHIDILIDREGKPISIVPVNEIPEQEMRTLRMIIPNMKYAPGNACEEPIEGYAKAVFDRYFVLRQPETGTEGLTPPQPLWRISKELGGQLEFYSMTYRNSVAIIDFHLDEKGNVTKLKGRSEYGQTLVSRIFRPSKESLVFLPARMGGNPVKSVVRLQIGEGMEIGKETVYLGQSNQPFHRISPWPESLPLKDLFTVDAELLLTDTGQVVDVVFLSQMPSEVSRQLASDLRVWKLDPADLPKKDGQKSMILKVAYDPKDKSPSLLKVQVRTVNTEIPEFVDREIPKYPPNLLRDGVSGIAVMKFVVKEDGTVGSIETMYATRPEFGEAVLKAARHWKFTTPKRNGEPVAMWFRINVPFNN